MTLGRRFSALAALGAALAVALAAGAAMAEVPVIKIMAAINTVRSQDRPGRDNIVTVWDGDKYIQCRYLVDQNLRCEAAGARMQSSLTHVLTPDHVERLTATGWEFDRSFGNYVHVFQPGIPAGKVAEKIILALAQGYDAKVEKLEIETGSIKREPCPPRNGPSQNLAGILNNAPAMASTSVHACTYHPPADTSPPALPPGSTAADLVKLYRPTVANALNRLRVNVRKPGLFVVFDTEIGYVQCQPDTDPDAFSCEAQSADSWPALASVLTPERIARLHAAGYEDPGRTQNYAKTYPLNTIDDAALAGEILTLLHDVYGYYGASPLKIGTEKGP